MLNFLRFFCVTLFCLPPLPSASQFQEIRVNMNKKRLWSATDIAVCTSNGMHAMARYKFGLIPGICPSGYQNVVKLSHN